MRLDERGILENGIHVFGRTDSIQLNKKQDLHVIRVVNRCFVVMVEEGKFPEIIGEYLDRHVTELMKELMNRKEELEP